MNTGSLRLNLMEVPEADRLKSDAAEGVRVGTESVSDHNIEYQG